MQDILRLRILLAAAALVLWSASAASAQARLWVIRDADSTIYLMGTVHLLRPGTEWRSPKIDAALKEATELWLETPDVDPSPQEEQAFRSLMLRAGMSTGAKVSDGLKPEERAQWFKAAEAVSSVIGLPALELLRPWAASMMLEAAEMTLAGYDPESGVETVLAKAAGDQGDRIKGLETSAEQITNLASLPDPVQFDMLRQTLKMFGSATMDRSVDAWSHGDLALMEQQFVEFKANAPELYDAVSAKRNESWANQIETLLKGSGVIFIAVGAGHLSGPDNLRTKLSAKGITVAEY